MNEITRIHIAKIAYDIELSAKKELEKYIGLLKEYANDEELFNDIEIRITELLAVRNVIANGVITGDDVASVREQLGDPKEFLNEDSNNNREVLDDDVKSKRLLYRNVDNALLGGVLSGIASYLKINTLWVRLVFVFLFLISAGTIILAYIILWIIIPPARTATEKLQMTGRSITLNSIKELNNDESNSLYYQERMATLRRVITVVVGLFCLCLSVITLIFTIFVALRINTENYFMNYIQSDMSWVYVTAFILAILAGLLLAILFAICSYAMFSNKFTKRILVSVVLVILIGLASFGTSIGLISYNPHVMNGYMQIYAKEKTVNVPQNFSDINDLIVDADGLRVEYVVSEKNEIVFKSASDIKSPSLKIDGKIATINVDAQKEEYLSYQNSVLVISGTKLDSITVKSGNLDYSSDIQDLTIKTIGPNSSVNLQKGKYLNLSANATDNSSINATMIAAEKVDIAIETGSKIYLGTINELVVVQSEVCPIDVKSTVNVDKVNLGEITFNGNVIKSETHDFSCGSIEIENK